MVDNNHVAHHLTSALLGAHVTHSEQPTCLCPRLIHRCLDIPIHHGQCHHASAHRQQLPFPGGSDVAQAFVTIPPIRAALKKTRERNDTCWTFVQHCTSLYKTDVPHGQPCASIAPPPVHVCTCGRCWHVLKHSVRVHATHPVTRIRQHGIKSCIPQSVGHCCNT